MNAPIALGMPPASLPSKRREPIQPVLRSSTRGPRRGSAGRAVPERTRHTLGPDRHRGRPSKEQPEGGAGKAPHPSRVARTGNDLASTSGASAVGCEVATSPVSEPGTSSPDAATATSATTLAGNPVAATGATDTTGTTIIAAPAIATLTSTPEAGAAGVPPSGLTSASAGAPGSNSAASELPPLLPASPATSALPASPRDNVRSRPPRLQARSRLRFRPHRLPRTSGFSAASPPVDAGTSTPAMASPVDGSASPVPTTSPTAAY